MARTLCEWDKRDIERELERLAGIIGVPRYVCRKCARSAQEDRHLCKPIRLPALASAGVSGSEAGVSHPPAKVLASPAGEPSFPSPSSI